MFSTFTLVFVYVTLGSVAGILGVPYSFLVGDIGLLYRIAMGIVRLGVRAAGIRVVVTGLEHVPVGRSCIFMANHVSNLDPPVLMPAIPGRSSVLLKRELMKIPILGTAMRMAKFVPVERGNKVEAAKASVAAAAEALRLGLHILVFPEGTRSKDGRLASFKKGPFFLAEGTGVPIVPVAISGTERMMQKGSVAIAPGVARVQMLPAVEPSAYGSREELMAAVREAIAGALPEEMRPAVHEVGSRE
jgi:1-acyl-sn-glycerol-3-phosphate acyltransferase